VPLQPSFDSDPVLYPKTKERKMPIFNGIHTSGALPRDKPTKPEKIRPLSC
jgi:hypothetical protein